MIDGLFCKTECKGKGFFWNKLIFTGIFCTPIVGKGVWTLVPVVRRVAFGGDALPLGSVIFGEESVGLGGQIVYFGEAEPVGQGQGIAIDAVAANDEDFVVGTAGLQGGLERGEDLRTGTNQVRLVREHNVAPVGQGALGQTFKRAAAHDDGVAGGEGFEALQIGTQVIQQPVAETYGAIASHGADDGEHFDGWI